MDRAGREASCCKKDRIPVFGLIYGLCHKWMKATEVLQQAKLQGQFQHVFSHYKLDASVWHPVSGVAEPAGSSWYNKEQVMEIGLPAPIRSWIEKNWLNKN